MTAESKKRLKQRVGAILAGGGCVLAPITPFYTAFVVQNLWDWFLADAVHATISYWQSCGILILVGVLRYKESHDYLENKRWERMLAMTGAVLSGEELSAINQAFKEKDESWGAILSMATPLAAKAIANTVAIGAGWVVHTFLM